MIFTVKYRSNGNKFFIEVLLISFLQLAGLAHLYSQTNFSRFDHFTTADGLSSNRIWCIYRDSKDYLWISTDVGLDKFDSYDVKKYRHDEKQPGSISSDNVLCIYEDQLKQLWFGTNNGLNLYSPATDKFTVFKTDTENENSLNGNLINSIIEDRDKNMWVLTDISCLNKWDPGKRTFLRFPFENKKSGLFSRRSKMIGADSKGLIWIVSFGSGIYCFDPKTTKFKKYDDPSVDFGADCFKSLYIDAEDKIWITTDGSGFFSYDPLSGKFEQYGSKGDGTGTNERSILDILPEDKDHLLLGVDQGGINRFNLKTHYFEYFKNDNIDNGGLNNNGIWCMYKDKEGILWVGTSGGGINYINPRKNKFRLFTHTTSPTSLSYSFTGCFYEDHEGKIWIGTDGGGVNVMDPVTGSFVVFKNIASDPYSLSGNVIRCITEDADHDMWIATWDAGLNRYDRKTKRFYRYMPEKNNPSSISRRNIWNIKLDHNGVLWLGYYAGGTDMFVKGKGVIRRFRSEGSGRNKLSSNQNNFFYEDKENNIWICTEKGIDRYDSKTDSITTFNFPDNGIGAFLRDRQGNLWVGTTTMGLYYCNPDGSIINNYNITNGLVNNRIQSILEDSRGYIWLSTSGGITRLDPKTQNLRNYTKEDGLQSNQFFQQSFLKTSKGEMYFGGFNGFNSFYPDSLKDNDVIPPVYLTDFQIFNEPVLYAEPGGQFPTHISEAKEIKLEWNQSVISFSFSGINYTSPANNQYKYILEGFEKNWNLTNSFRRYVTYTNLDPGDYTLRVIASNNDGIWNEKGISLRIVVLPPWWKTIWFRLTSLLIIAFLISSIFILRVRTFKKQKKQLEQTVLIKTAELREKNDVLIRQTDELNKSNSLLEERRKQIEKQSDELSSQKEALVEMNEELNASNISKDKFFSIIAHDLKNPFNSIIGFSSILKEDVLLRNPIEIEKSATVINDSAVHPYRLLENLLEWANSQSGKISYNPGSLDLNNILILEFNTLKDIASAKNIELVSYIDNSLKILADRNMLRTILRNLISNAIKFTPRNGIVTVKASITDIHAEISVIDNGIGMTQETMAQLFRIDANLTTRGTENEKGTGLGLFLCKEFVVKHGWQISVESNPGTGSVFKLILPLTSIL